MPKILIIDDQQSILNFLVRVTKSMGYEVVTALDGSIACDLVTDPSIQLIISDLYMPGTPSKMELIRQLCALRPKCPIVVVSGYPSEDYIKECQQLGIKDFLTKPFEISFVCSLLSKLVPLPDKSNRKVTP